MSFLFDLYPQCLDAFELLKIVPELPEAKSDTELAVIAQLKQLPGVTYENRQALKERGLRRSDLALKKWLSQGAYIGLGFRSIDDLEPSVIPHHEWCSLAIDYKDSRAFCTGRDYTGVRFMNARMLKELPNDQIEFIDRAAKGKPQVEVLGDGAVVESQASAKPASTKIVQVKSNNTEFSGLLNIPEKKDDWFPAIDDMTKAFFNEYKKIPNKSQAWAQLWDSPPGGYRITNGTDKGGEACLKMPGAKPSTLSSSSFLGRWGRYTANKP